MEFFDLEGILGKKRLNPTVIQNNISKNILMIQSLIILKDHKYPNYYSKSVHHDLAILTFGHVPRPGKACSVCQNASGRERPLLLFMWTWTWQQVR